MVRQGRFSGCKPAFQSRADPGDNPVCWRLGRLPWRICHRENQHSLKSGWIRGIFVQNGHNDAAPKASLLEGEGSSARWPGGTFLSMWRWSMKVPRRFRGILTVGLHPSIVSDAIGRSRRQQWRGQGPRSGRFSGPSHWIAVVTLLPRGATNAFAFWPPLRDVPADKRFNDYYFV